MVEQKHNILDGGIVSIGVLTSVLESMPVVILIGTAILTVLRVVQIAWELVEKYRAKKNEQSDKKAD